MDDLGYSNNVATEKASPNKSSDNDEKNGNKNTAVEQLAGGFLGLYETDLCQIKGSLHEILLKQGRMAEDLQELNNNYAGESLDEAKLLFDKVRIYKDKLHYIKKQMTSIHQRSKTLKKRVQILQEFCVKEHDERKDKQKQEEALIAKFPPK